MAWPCVAAPTRPNIKTRELGLAVRRLADGEYVGEAAFVTGSAAGVVAVGEVDGRPYEGAEHPLVCRSHERYLERTDPSHLREVSARAGAETGAA